MRILIIEDDRRLQGALARTFEKETMAADVASTGAEGIFLGQTNDYDVIVLDLMLPDMEGIRVCKTIRQQGKSTPILMLTALDDAANKIRGLDAGADDYLTKPFHAGELLARVRALIRRVYNEPVPILGLADLELDTATRKVSRNGQSIPLTAKEFSLLEYLFLRKNQIVTRGEIAEHVWDLNFDPQSNVIEALVRLLRKKIDDPFERKLIRTVRGHGYTLTEDT